MPWSNSSPRYPIHYIYRNNVNGNNSDDYILIDSVDVIENGFKYLDDGSFEDISLDENKVYCYFVITSGSYENDKLPLNVVYNDKLLNKSQKICAQTNDLTPPCPPVKFKISDEYLCENYFSDKSCEIKDFENRIDWEIEDDPCYLDSKFFNVYFSINGQNNFNLIGTVSENYFVHKI